MLMKRLDVAMAFAFMVSPMAAQADVSVFVDHYKTNVSANTRVDTNAALFLLQGYSALWNSGDAWNTGTPTAIGQAVLEANQAYVVKASTERTAAQAEAAYLTDRRHQSFSAIAGLGDLAAAYRTASGATTTILGMPADALTGKYDDKGSGAGLTGSASVGRIVTLVNTVRGSYSSSNPAKNYFNSPRPWRLNDSFQVVQTGTETTGYYTSTLADGSPNTTVAPVFFPVYDSNVVVVPELLAARSSNPASDGGFVSGHTNAAYLASLSMAYAMPERYHSLLMNASQMGEDRIVAGMHLPLDVIGGRVLATALSAAILNDPANAALKADALAQGKAFVAANMAAESRFDAYDANALANNRSERALYTFRMTYGLPTTGNGDVAAKVPKGAEVLLESRFAYLSAEQRREVLRTTAIASGHAVLDDAEGWGRLNLYAAADGYGRFDSDVVVTMNADAGGFDARDSWRNDISGVGGLVKQGSGELGLSGDNRYSGGTRILGGSLIAASATALGSGDVLVGEGASLVNYAPMALRLSGDYTQLDGGRLEIVVGAGSDGLLRGLMQIDGMASLDGTLQLTFLDGYELSDDVRYLMRFAARQGSFDSIEVSGLSSAYRISYVADGIQISAVPEADAWALLLAGLGVMGWMVRRRA